MYMMYGAQSFKLAWKAHPTHLTHELERTIETIETAWHKVGDHNPADRSASASMNGLAY